MAAHPPTAPGVADPDTRTRHLIDAVADSPGLSERTLLRLARIDRVDRVDDDALSSKATLDALATGALQRTLAMHHDGRPFRAYWLGTTNGDALLFARAASVLSRPAATSSPAVDRQIRTLAAAARRLACVGFCERAAEVTLLAYAGGAHSNPGLARLDGSTPAAQKSYSPFVQAPVATIRFLYLTARSEALKSVRADLTATLEAL